MQNTNEQIIPEFKRRKFQFMNIRYQLVGRGITGEIATLYVNGKEIKDFATIDAFYNAYGQ